MKYCVLMCGDDNDMEIIKAAAGALAMLTEVGYKLFLFSSEATL